MADAHPRTPIPSDTFLEPDPGIDPDRDPPYVGRGGTWLAAGLDELDPAPGRPTRRVEQPAPRPTAVDPGPGRQEKGRADAAALRALLDEADDLRGDQREAFERMLTDIDPQFGRYPHLTDRQRGWVRSMLEERGIDPRPAEERNRSVPRGREVAPGWGQLPLSPPGFGASRVAEEVVRGAMPGASSLVRMGAAADLEAFVEREIESDRTCAGPAAALAGAFLLDAAPLGGAGRRTIPAGTPAAATPRPTLLPEARPSPDVELTESGAKLFREGAPVDAPEPAKRFRVARVNDARAAAMRDRRTVRILDGKGEELGSVDPRGFYSPPAGEAPRRRRRA